MRNLYKYIFIGSIYFFSTQIFAVPSAGILQRLTQTNGSVVYAIQKGDEWNNWMETHDGYTIKKNPNGNWYYYLPKKMLAGKVKNKAILANQPPPPYLKKGIREKPKTHPIRFIPKKKKKSIWQKKATGFEGNVLFILADFSNKRGSTTETSWSNFIKENIADYYHKVSYSNVTLKPAKETFGTQNNGVIGWVTIGNYHPNTKGDLGTANEIITKNAIIAANPFINYASYDKNHDGFVDSRELAIVVIVAGYESSYSDYSPGVWGHAYYLAYPPVVDNVIVGAYKNGFGYAQFGEIHQSKLSDRHQATMGIMVHELGHLIFDFPDLYDIDGSSKGIGAYGVMGFGSWGAKKNDNYAGETPVFPSAWIQYYYGWANGKGDSFQNITAVSSPNANNHNTVLHYSTTNPNQYFLLQNRQDQGYDRGLERYLGANFKGGLLIYHIDESQFDNSNDTRRLVDVEEANGSDLSFPPYSSDKHFWRQGNAVTFNNDSHPNSKLNNGDPSGVNINSISRSMENMSVNLESSTQWLEPVIDLILN